MTVQVRTHYFDDGSINAYLELVEEPWQKDAANVVDVETGERFDRYVEQFSSLRRALNYISDLPQPCRLFNYTF